MNRIKLAWIFIATGLLSGCFSTSFLYDNADGYVYDKIDEYFVIADRQEVQLNEDIAEFFDWHRRHELPEYAKIISTFTMQFSDGLTENELSHLFQQLIAARIRFNEQNLTSASEFLARIDKKQLENFDRVEQLDLIEDRERAEMPNDKRKQALYDRLLKRAEDWLGDFSDEQKIQLRLISDSRIDNYAQRINQREIKHKKFIKFLSENPSVSSIKTYLKAHYIRPYRENSNQLIKENRDSWLNALLKIDKLITPEQREFAISRLKGYQQDFVEISLE